MVKGNFLLIALLGAELSSVAVFVDIPCRNFPILWRDQFLFLLFKNWMGDFPFVCVCVCAPLCAGKSVLISNLSISVLLLLLRIVRVIPYHLYNFQSPFLFKLKQPDLYKQYVKLWNFDHKCKKNNKIFLYTAELNFWRTPKIYYAAKFQKNVLNSYN